MGYSLSLLAVPTANAAEALEQLGYSRTGRLCEFAREPLSSCALPTNWFLLVARGSDNRFLQPKTLGLLSSHFPVIACSIEEHVMFSSAAYWSGGNQVWRVEHVGENRPTHLQTAGILPPGFEQMAAELMQAQVAAGGEKADVDHYFDIPLNAAKEVIGFKHDEDIPGVDYEGFEVLRPTSPSADGKPWWRFWR